MVMTVNASANSFVIALLKLVALIKYAH